MSVEQEMPRYKCHKEVHALKIKKIDVSHVGVPFAKLTFEDPGYGPINVPTEWVGKHEAVAGGYYVVYQDGYASFSPAEAFEAGYTRI